jgi:uncharacterized membrane protein
VLKLVKRILDKSPGARRLREALFLAALSFFCFCMSVFRCFYTGSRNFLFLNWNLFLAFIPWALTSLAVLKPPVHGDGTRILRGKSKLKTALLVICWLLFFPNAPYILTDLFYLRLRTNAPIWYDLLLILSFSWTGLFFGFLSLWDIESILSRFFKPHHITIISTIFLFIGGFGIYIGRYLRWNSWDVIIKPLGLMYDISYRFINPHEHPGTWGLTIFMGFFLNMLYWSFRFMRKRNSPR